jgi:flagellar protein FliS
MSVYSPVSRYMNDSITTADPAKLLVMLYDRLVLDLDRADTALHHGVPANEHLLHAQDILSELLSTLDLKAWAGAAKLSALYTFMLTELINANVHRDAAKVASVRELVVPLRDAWREAALQTLAATAPAHVDVAS